MKNNGITLLEVLVAAAIMVAAMVPLWGLLGTSHQQVIVSADEVRAGQLANEILEQIENSGWLPDPGQISFDLVKNSSVSVGPAAEVSLKTGDFPDYMKPQVTLDIEKYPADAVKAGRLLQLQLNYQLREKVGKEVKTYQISTFIANN
jgi:type II secretory pathway pseudopilin PulG